MLGKAELALAIPLTLLDSDFLLALGIHQIHAIATDGEHLHTLRLHTLQVDFKTLVLAHVRHRKIDVPVISQRSAAVQEWRFNRPANPARICPSAVLGRPYVERNSLTAHILAEEQQRPPDGLLDQPILRRHERRNDIYALRDIRHAHILCLANESVQEDGNSQRVAQRVLFFRTLLTRCANRIPHIPLVEANRRPGYRLGNLVFNPRKINQRTRHLNRAFRRSRGRRVGQMLVVRRVNVDGMHIDECFCRITAEAMHIPFDALVEHVVVPGGVTSFTTQDEGDRRVEKFESFGPLPGFLCVVFFGHLLDLPGAPAFVSEGPVFDL